MSDTPETIDLCYFSVDVRVGEPAVIVEEDFGGPFDVNYGVEYTRPKPGRKGGEYRSSETRIGRAECQIYNGRVVGYTWDLATNREEAMARLHDRVASVLNQEIMRFQASLDGMRVAEVERNPAGPAP